METNKEITAEEFYKWIVNPEKYKESKLEYKDYAINAFKEFAMMHLSKQAEFIAENVLLELKESDFGRLEWVVDKQSIINAGEEYKNSVK